MARCAKRPDATIMPDDIKMKGLQIALCVLLRGNARAFNQPTHRPRHQRPPPAQCHTPITSSRQIHSRHALALHAAVIIACALNASCGNPDTGTGYPDATIGPEPQVAFAFRNPTQTPLYIDWSTAPIVFSVLRDGDPLIINLDCIADCDAACTCTACAEPRAKARRLDPGQQLSLSWVPTYYETATCQGVTPCTCGQAWPVTVGDYDVKLNARSGVVGGSPDPDDSAVLDDATLDLATPLCVATASFTLGTDKSIEALFSCSSP